MDTLIIESYDLSGLGEGLAFGKLSYVQGTGQKNSVYSSDFYDQLATTPYQTHSNNVKVVESEYEWDNHDTDALVTFMDDVAIGVRTADCVPILLYAEDVNGTAAIHAGWKGSLNGIVDKTLDVLEEGGAELSKLKAVFGPSISKQYYEVDTEMAEKFIEAGFGEYVSYPDGKEGKPHLDLQGVNKERMLRRGVLRDNIRLSDYCTFSSRKKDGSYRFPSYRRDKTDDRLLTSIMKLSEEKYEAVIRHREQVFKWANE